MNKVFYELLTNWPLAVIKDEDIEAKFPDEDAKRRSLIRRYVNKGWPIRLKRGVYALTKSSYEVAQYLYPPSYISFETALSIHGLIPEAIHHISSATFKRNKIYQTSLGNFYFHYIPLNNFFLGVIKRESFLLATPLKAIADIYYTQKRKWNTWSDVCEDLRLDDEQLLFKNRKILFDLKSEYPSQKVRRFLSRLKE